MIDPEAMRSRSRWAHSPDSVWGLWPPSVLANRKRELGISFESGRRLGAELAWNHGIDLGRGLGIGL